DFEASGTLPRHLRRDQKARWAGSSTALALQSGRHDLAFRARCGQSRPPPALRHVLQSRAHTDRPAQGNVHLRRTMQFEWRGSWTSELSRLSEQVAQIALRTVRPDAVRGLQVEGANREGRSRG